MGMDSESQEPKPVDDQALKGVENDQTLKVDRDAIVDEWLSEAGVIAAISGNTEAQAIMEFLNERAVTAEPIKGGWRMATNQSRESAIYVLPLIAADAQIDDHFRQSLVDSRSAASYYPGNRILQLNDSVPTSLAWKGILVLHEGMHAKVHSEENYDWHDPIVFSAKERDTFVFQGDVMSKIGGKPFEEALQSKLEELERNVAEDDRGRVSFPGWGSYDERLDVAFGPALSEMEKATRQTALWIDAVFQLFDRRYGEEQGAKEKTLFMRSMYSK